jgi:hypothetical protein
MNRLEDDRTSAAKHSHTILVGGIDSFLSGWGPCEGGKSYAFWACRPEDADRAALWVRARGDMRWVRMRQGDYRPSIGPRDHCHIYVVGENHPALRGEL